ncbi:hypothetical protein RPPS3_09510 [Rhodopseudomonas palustris]|nr:hypothetical protein RPPS3_09510 [Rhodopseudomonas palustris]
MAVKGGSNTSALEYWFPRLRGDDASRLSTGDMAAVNRALAIFLGIV